MTIKTKKRVLFSISKKSEIPAAFKFSQAIKKYFDNVETCVVYVKDVSKYEIFQNNISGYSMTNAATMVMNEYKEIEDNFYEEIKEKSKSYFDKVYSITGESMEVITEEMKAYDLLVVVRDEGNLTSSLTDIIRSHYKPLIIINENGTDFKFDKILMLNDGGYKVNKSVFSYFNIFGESKVDVLRVNVEDRDRLTERFGEICNLIHKNGDEVEIISEYIPKYDIVIMGGLNYPAFFERFTGQTGLKIIETSNKPIFIG